MVVRSFNKARKEKSKSPRNETLALYLWLQSKRDGELNNPAGCVQGMEGYGWRGEWLGSGDQAASTAWDQRLLGRVGWWLCYRQGGVSERPSHMPASSVNPTALKDTRPHGQGTRGQGRKEMQKEEEERWRSQEKRTEEELARSGACWGCIGRDKDG